MMDTGEKHRHPAGNMFDRLPYYLFIKRQIGFVEYQYRIDIFFQYLNHETFDPADIEIIIEALHNKRLIHIRCNRLFLGYCPAFLAVQCPFTGQHIDDNPFTIVERLKQNPIARTRQFKVRSSIHHISRQLTLEQSVFGNNFITGAMHDGYPSVR